MKLRFSWRALLVGHVDEPGQPRLCGANVVDDDVEPTVAESDGDEVGRPPGVDRSTSTASTAPSPTSASSSLLLSRAPATTWTPSSTSACVMARPMPLLRR